MRGRKAIDLTGQRFGRLVAIRSEKVRAAARQWLCRCDCGNTTWGRSGALRGGHKRSCGCLLRDRANQYGPQVCITCNEEKPPEAFARPHGRPPRKRCKDCNDAILASHNRSLANIASNPEAVDKFMAKVDTNGPGGCWIWKGTIDRSGYGAFAFKGRNLKPHRLAYAIYKKEPGELCVCHQCDRKRCVNPNHLFLGTIADNTRDRDKKHRVQWGEQHYRTKLKPHQVRAIRASKLSTTTLSELYGVTSSHIARIRTGQTWSRLD